MTSNTLVREPVGVTLSTRRVASGDHNEEQLTELQLAAQVGHTQDVNEMLVAHADPNAANACGTALHFAARTGQKEIVEILLRAGAKVDARDANGRTPLNYAILDLHDNVTKVLLDAGANPSSKDIFGWTPLHDAAKYGLEGLAKMLLEKNPVVDSQDRNGQTPLHQTAIYRTGTVMRMLLDKKADQAIKCKAGHIPYEYACQLHGGWKEGQDILWEDLHREAERQFHAGLIRR
jgi:ankyrin repeat protein